MPGGSKILSSGFSGTVVPQGDGSHLLLRMQIRPRGGRCGWRCRWCAAACERELARDVITIKARLERRGGNKSTGPHQRTGA